MLRFFTASDGARLAYRDVGHGRPIVFLHGLMAHSGFFREQAPLARHFRLVSLDLRGHGASAREGERPSVGQIADDVAELVAALDIKEAIGVGWSLGATVLWHLLMGSEATRFSGAVVVDMTARVLNDVDWELGLSPEACEARTSAIRSDFRSFAADAGNGIFAQAGSGGSHELADWAGAEFARNDPEAIAALWTSLVAEDGRALLSRIDQPTLVVHGAQSSLYGKETAEHLVAALSNARAVRFEGSGHAPHLEQPQLFNATLREFADSLSLARPTPLEI
jgi:pimeloyl-ACP methyl ester carboxylesterase